ncbi:MAG: hypothetical protein MPJ50_04420 [Pirellulales bacterium]|nr:hypothetical protein [Pirellulales bacterium]
MAEINLANSAGRDAVVDAENVVEPRRIRWVDSAGRQVQSVRILKSTIGQDFEALAEKFGSNAEVAHALMDGDPEVDLEVVGALLKETSRVFIDDKRNIVHRINHWEVIRGPDGKERERRPRNLLPPNVTGDSSLRWSGVFIAKEEAYRRFVFVNKLQIQHINGLTYDFLFAMAKELQERNALMLLGAGPKSKQPLILRRGGVPHRGFLEGRVQGDAYCLLLHLSNLELKSTTPDE